MYSQRENLLHILSGNKGQYLPDGRNFLTDRQVIMSCIINEDVREQDTIVQQQNIVSQRTISLREAAPPIGIISAPYCQYPAPLLKQMANIAKQFIQ